MKVGVVLNPVAGGGRLKRDWPRAATALRGHFGDFELRETQAEGDAERRAEPAVQDRRNEEVRRDEGPRRVDRAMPERRDVERPRDKVQRQIMRPRVQHFPAERRAMGDRSEPHGGRRRF